MLGQHDIKSFAVFVYGSVKIDPRALHLDVGLAHSPRTVARFFAATRGLGSRARVSFHPAVQSSVVHRNAALTHDFF